jgi:hypothetical protein
MRQDSVRGSDWTRPWRKPPAEACLACAPTQAPVVVRRASLSGVTVTGVAHLAFVAHASHHFEATRHPTLSSDASRSDRSVHGKQLPEKRPQRGRAEGTRPRLPVPSQRYGCLPHRRIRRAREVALRGWLLAQREATSCPPPRPGALLPLWSDAFAEPHACLDLPGPFGSGAGAPW